MFWLKKKEKQNGTDEAQLSVQCSVHRTSLTGNFGETSEFFCGVYVDFPKHFGTIFTWIDC